MSQSHSAGDGAGGGAGAGAGAGVGCGNPSPPAMNAAIRRAEDQPGLTRYGSAPGSLLARVADSIIAGCAAGDEGFRAFMGSDGQMSRFLPRESPCLTSDSGGACAVASAELDLRRSGERGGRPANFGLRQPFELPGDGRAKDLVLSSSATGESRTGEFHLARQHSSPAGFLSHLMVENGGFTATRGTRNYFQSANDGTNAMTGRRLKSQLSFARQDSVSQVSDVSIPEMGESSDEAVGNVGQSYIPSSYPMSSWDETTSIVFSTNKRFRDNNGDIISNLTNIDSQYGLPETSLDMAAVDKLLQGQQDSIPFKIRAKRGCATHPRSIAERERRTRISEKLRKLQEIVPNMDKQTSTADMLDLAVQHIKGLQSQIQILKQEQASCTCVSTDEDTS